MVSCKPLTVAQLRRIDAVHVLQQDVIILLMNKYVVYHMCEKVCVFSAAAKLLSSHTIAAAYDCASVNSAL